MKHPRSVKHSRAIGVVAVLLGLSEPTCALGQSAGSPVPDSAPGQMLPTDPYPDLRVGREILFLGVGGGLLLSGYLVPVSTLEVPPGGLDPTEISWGADRSVVGNRSTSANNASDWSRNAALMFPLALAFVTATPGERWHDLGVHGVVYAETLLFSQGSTLLGKTVWSRPRPYAFLPGSQRPDDPSYDVSKNRTFRSMPSGHSSSAWTGVALGITEHLLSRPDASWVERVGVAFVGGGLAGATSALRVTAGQHFRSDVLTGAGIGIVTGVGVPLLHRGPRQLPSSREWLEAMGGMLAGTMVGVLVGR